MNAEIPYVVTHTRAGAVVQTARVFAGRGDAVMVGRRMLDFSPAGDTVTIDHRGALVCELVKHPGNGPAASRVECRFTDHPLPGKDARMLPKSRADIVTARNTLERIAAGADDADSVTAAAMLDHTLKRECPHDPATWHTAPDAAGRPLTTCGACGVSWYEHP